MYAHLMRERMQDCVAVQELHSTHGRARLTPGFTFVTLLPAGLVTGKTSSSVRRAGP